MRAATAHGVAPSACDDGPCTRPPRPRWTTSPHSSPSSPATGESCSCTATGCWGRSPQPATNRAYSETNRELSRIYNRLEKVVVSGRTPIFDGPVRGLTLLEARRFDGSDNVVLRYGTA